MVADGFVLASCDGSMPQGGLWGHLPRPSEFSGLRPDTYGTMPITGEFAVGEAKTAGDLDTDHTRKQLYVFGRVRTCPGNLACRLYVAVPRSAAPALDRVLARVGLLGAKHVFRLHIPDCFLVESRDACA